MDSAWSKYKLQRPSRKTTRVKFVLVMAVIFLMTFIVSLFPIMITIMFLTAPAIIMNIGWLMFAGAV